LLTAYRWVWQRQRDWAVLLLGVVALGSVYLELSAPGNAVRIGSNPEGRQLTAALVACFKTMLRQIWLWLDVGVLTSTGLFALLMYQRPRTDFLLSINPLITFLGWVFLLAFLFLPHYYGVGVHVPPPDRVLDSVHFFFLLGWFYNVAVLITWLSRFAPDSSQKVFSLPKTWWILAFILAIYSTKYPAIRLMYKDLLSGTAYRYDREMYARYEKLQTIPGDTATVAPLKNVPASLFVEDIRTQPQHLWNRCYADYFRRKTVVLTEK
ncbi:MAG: DUF6056 family protein, partial [Cytophagaceae bacterium]|nr:DUF6056 family protein [Cytophagaceae bacterium]